MNINSLRDGRPRRWNTLDPGCPWVDTPPAVAVFLAAGPPWLRASLTSTADLPSVLRPFSGVGDFPLSAPLTCPRKDAE